MLNLRALHYLVTLADLRHFSKAAAACFVSQPTLSTQIRKLEEQLDVQLVERSSRKVLLTPIGEDIVTTARQILQNVDSIKRQARHSREPGAGTLKIGIFPTLAPYLLPHVIPGIKAKYPALSLQLVEEKTEEIILQLRQGKLDAALLALPVDSPQLCHTILFDEPFVMATSNSHPLADRKNITIKDLKNEPLLLLEEGHCLREQALEVCELAGTQQNMDFHATSIETLRHMVASGSGTTLMPLLAVKAPIAETPNLCIRPFSGKPPKRTIGMFWRRSSAQHDFITQLAPLFGQLDSTLLSVN